MSFNHNTHKDIADFPDPEHWHNVMQRARDALEAIEARKWPAILNVSFSVPNHAAINVLKFAIKDGAHLEISRLAENPVSIGVAIGLECSAGNINAPGPVKLSDA